MKPFNFRFLIILFFSFLSFNSYAYTHAQAAAYCASQVAADYVCVDLPSTNVTDCSGFYYLAKSGYHDIFIQEYSGCPAAASPANYGCVYNANGSKAGTTAGGTNCSGAGGFNMYTGYDAQAPYCTDGPAGTSLSTNGSASCPATYTPTATNTKPNPLPPPAPKSSATAPAPASPASGTPATAPSTPNQGSNPSNGSGASSSSSTTTTNPDGTTTTVTNTTSTTSIDTSSLNQQATQEEIKQGIDKLNAGLDTSGLDGTTSGSQATSVVSSALDSITSAINGNTSANHGLAPSSGFLSQFGSTCGCSPLTLSYHGASVSYDWCPMIQKMRDGLSFIFYVIVAWSIFLMLSEMRV